MQEICSSCEQQCYWANRTKKLCQTCNHIRLHGETPKETALKQQQRYQAKLQQKTKPNQVSDKQKKINTAMTKVKAKVVEDALSNEKLECRGCLKTENLTRSHILSVAQRPDLQLIPDNIELLCMSCHAKWESWNIEQMTSLISFTANLRHIFDYDSETYHRILYKVEDWLKANTKENKQIIYNRVERMYQEISSFEDFYCNKFLNGRKRCNSQCGKCRNM